MRISLNWLRELVDFDLPPEALADALTMAGFEVEDIEDRRTWANGVIVGQILQCDPHPNADKLNVCQVDIGGETPSSIVCGAANVKAGIQVAVATVGTYLPIVDLTIKARELRGVPSAGMICSLAEIGLAKESEGIHIFDPAGLSGELSVGEDARPHLGLDDVVLDLTSTANRADALSMVGIAREVAAITGATLKLPDAPAPIIEGNGATGLSVTLSDAKACPIYTGTVLTQIKITPSPLWLQQRLQAAGTRPINNIVDITNYVLLEWGQPLHAFDRDRLLTVTQSDRLTLGVRYAKSDETLVTLDSQKRQLEAETLLITANDIPVALAGVMGGEDTEVHGDTQTVMLEAAYFDPAAIRRSARSQGLRTEASARYERGVNPAELEAACNRALQLMQDLAGATVVTQASDRTESGHITPSRTLTLRLTRVNEILGPIKTDQGLSLLSATDVETVLTKLGCEAETNTAGGWTVSIPPYRYRDLEREIDLIEEVARLYGYDNFADTLPNEADAGFLSPEAALARRVREAFRGAGLTELIHYSVTRPLDAKQVVIANPLFSEYSALRADLITGLIDAFQFNLEQGNGPLNGFEMGHIFWVNESGQHEAEALGGVMGGDRRSGQWVSAGQDQPLTWYAAKGILDAVFQRIGLAVDFRPDREDTRLHPGRTASLWVRGRTRLGTFGQLHPQLRQSRGLPDEVYLFDLDWSVMVTCLAPTKRGAATVFKSYSTFPPSDRDIAFYAPTEVSVGELERLITKTGGKLLESVTLFDEYRGDTVPEGQRSLAFRLIYRASDRTLTDNDVEPVHQKVREALEKQFKVSLRS
ncbi:MAG: phenylalanine--tRNA ligase subunit beta [Cyanobacteria bacterium J06635_15]